MRRAVTWMYDDVGLGVGYGPEAVPSPTLDPSSSYLMTGAPQAPLSTITALHGGCLECRRLHEDWSRRRAVVGELRLHTVGAVESKE